MRLTAVTHRNNPIFWGTLEGHPPNESSMMRLVGTTVGAWSKVLAMGIPGVKELLVTVSMDRQYDGGNARQVINGIDVPCSSKGSSSRPRAWPSDELMRTVEKKWAGKGLF